MPETFPAALRRLREAAGLSQRQVAASLKVSQPAVARMESGASRPSYEVLCKLVSLLGCDAGELIETTTTKEGR